MKIIVRIVFLSIAVAVAIWLWTIIFPSPEKIIRTRLAQIAAEVSFGPNENPLIIANNAEELAGRFSTNVEVHLDVPNHEEHTFAGRDDILQAAAAAHSQLQSLNVEIFDVAVTVNADKISASASATVRAKSSRNDDEMLQPIKFTFQKFGRDWLVTRVETLRTLS